MFRSLSLILLSSLLLLAACGGEERQSTDNNDPGSTSESTSESSGPPPLWIVGEEAADVYACNADDCEIIGSIEAGTVLNVISSEPEWLEISFEEDSRGFVRMSAVTFFDPNASLPPISETGGPPGLPSDYTDSSFLTATFELPPGFPTFDPNYVTPTLDFSGPPGIPTFDPNLPTATFPQFPPGVTPASLVPSATLELPPFLQPTATPTQAN